MSINNKIRNFDSVYFPKELINIMGATLEDISVELKLKLSRIKYLACKLLCLPDFIFYSNKFLFF